MVGLDHDKVDLLLLASAEELRGALCIYYYLLGCAVSVIDESLGEGLCCWEQAPLAQVEPFAVEAFRCRIHGGMLVHDAIVEELVPVGFVVPVVPVVPVVAVLAVLARLVAGVA